LQGVLLDRDREQDDLAGGHDTAARRRDQQQHAQVVARAQDVDRDVEDRDRLDEVGAIDTERTDGIGRDADADDARDEKQDDGDGVRRARRGQTLLGPQSDKPCRGEGQGTRGGRQAPEGEAPRPVPRDNLCNIRPDAFIGGAGHAHSIVPYTPSKYWSDLHVRRDLSAVGQSGLNSAMNQQLYRIWARNLRRFLKRNGVQRIGPTAFEVGAGTGYWLPLWRELGAGRIDGCDLVPSAVDDLNSRFGPSGGFIVLDLGDEKVGLDCYDFVACMDVLLHITDDAKFDRALANLARLVAPGGRLLMKEPILLREGFERPYNPELSSRARPLSRYRAGLEAQGLKLEAI